MIEMRGGIVDAAALAALAAVAAGGLVLLGAFGWFAVGATIAHILSSAGLAACL